VGCAGGGGRATQLAANRSDCQHAIAWAEISQQGPELMGVKAWCAYLPVINHLLTEPLNSCAAWLGAACGRYADEAMWQSHACIVHVLSNSWVLALRIPPRSKDL
jgi:hypothetical protein